MLPASEAEVQALPKLAHSVCQQNCITGCSSDKGVLTLEVLTCVTLMHILFQAELLFVCAGLTRDSLRRPAAQGSLLGPGATVSTDLTVVIAALQKLQQQCRQQVA